MEKTILTPTLEHTVFAWLPVLVFDRNTTNAKTVWLQRVRRKMVSVQGVVMWQYLPFERPVLPVTGA